MRARHIKPNRSPRFAVCKEEYSESYRSAPSAPTLHQSALQGLCRLPVQTLSPTGLGAVSSQRLQRISCLPTLSPHYRSWIEAGKLIKIFDTSRPFPLVGIRETLLNVWPFLCLGENRFAALLGRMPERTKSFKYFSLGRRYVRNFEPITSYLLPPVRRLFRGREAANSPQNKDTGSATKLCHRIPGQSLRMLRKLRD